MDQSEMRLACLKLATEMLRSEIGVPPDEILALAERLYEFIQNGQHTIG